MGRFAAKTNLMRFGMNRIKLHPRWLAVMVLFWLAGCHGFILAGGNASPENLALAAGILHVLNESIDHCKKH